VTVINFFEKTKSFLIPTKDYAIFFFKWLLLGIIMGVSGGAVGTFFSKSIAFVTQLRNQNGWLLYLLPLGGIIIAIIYHFFKIQDVGTNEVFEGVRTEKNVPILLAPAIFIGSVITHLLGGSAGREGAALQLGGSIASLLGKGFKLCEKSRHILIMCGMSAVFSAVFGTPICAAIFAVEVVSIGYMFSFALFPCLISSVTAYFLSASLGIIPEHFTVKFIPELSIISLGQVFLIGIACAIVSTVFCKAMHLSHKLFSKYIKNSFLRAAIGGLIIVLLTVIIGTRDYNGGGMDIIEKIFHSSEVKPEAFLLKIIFTAITIGAGFKGGEIVPTLFIGATLGGTLAILIGASAPFGAALGMVALFCGVTNCPLASLVLSLELFGGEGIIYYALALTISFLLSGYSSLYHGQKIIFSKLCEDIIEINGK